MHRFLILFSLVPLVASLAIRKLLADRVLKVAEGKQYSYSAEATARKMLDALNHEDVVIKLTHKPLFTQSKIKEKQIIVSSKVAQDKSASAHGKAALHVGLYLVSLRNPAMIARRQWAIRFGHAFPIFTTIVVIFACVVAKLAILLALAIVLASLGIAACAQILTVLTERQAAELASIVIEKKRLFSRSGQENEVIESLKAWSWHGAVPGLLTKFL